MFDKSKFKSCKGNLVTNRPQNDEHGRDLTTVLIIKEKFVET